jgi:putative hydrolase of the HAD superfamily
VIRYALFDLDDTLYPPESGIMSRVGVRIESYLTDRLGWPAGEAARLRREYRDEFGTTLGGLLMHHKADPEDYLRYVHDVPVEEIIHPDPALDRMLASLPCECLIFTNSDWRHAERVLAALGVRQRFTRIFDITGTGYLQKPHPAVYEHVLGALGCTGAACLLADDGLKNLLGAKAFQMTTVWVGRQAGAAAGIDFAVPSVLGLSQVLEEIERHERRASHDRSASTPCTDG